MHNVNTCDFTLFTFYDFTLLHTVIGLGQILIIYYSNWSFSTILYRPSKGVHKEKTYDFTLFTFYIFTLLGLKGIFRMKNLESSDKTLIFAVIN